MHGRRRDSSRRARLPTPGSAGAAVDGVALRTRAAASGLLALLAAACSTAPPAPDDGFDARGDDSDAEATDGPNCLVDLLLVLDVHLYGPTSTCMIVGGCDYVQFDRRLASVGVAGYHLGSVFAIGGYPWYGTERPCASYSLLSPGVLNDAETLQPLACEDLGGVRWADGPGPTAARDAFCLTSFGIPGDSGPCYPRAEAFKVVRLATSPPLVESANAGMFRPEALLVVAFLIPKDDCSIQDPWVYEHFGEWPSVCGVDPAWEDWLEGVDAFVSHLQDLHGGNVAVAVWGGADGVPAEVTDPDGTRRLQELCSLGYISVTPSPRFHEVLRSLGVRGRFFDACTTSFQDFLLGLADFVGERLPAQCRVGS